MADEKSDLFEQFEEFLKQKQEAENAEKEAEDFEVEIWDEKGRGVRTRRSHAKPFLQSLGIDVDSPSDDGNSGDDGNKGKGDKKGPGSDKPRATGSQSVARKYFVKGK